MILRGYERLVNEEGPFTVVQKWWFESESQWLIPRLPNFKQRHRLNDNLHHVARSAEQFAIYFI
jgi:hypothetical protein